jgi:hypothetical protein
LHFFKKLALAAPTSGLPSLLTALLSQDSCVNAGPKFRDSTKTASKIRFIISLSPVALDAAFLAAEPLRASLLRFT